MLTHTNYAKAVALAAALSIGAIAFGDDTVPPTPAPTHSATDMPGGKPSSPDSPANAIHGGMQQNGMASDRVVDRDLKMIAKAGPAAGDKLFVLNNACGNMWEVQFSNLVASRTQDQQMKTLAQQIATDHEQANQKLMAVAKDLDVELPTGLSSMKQGELDVYSSMPTDMLEKSYLCDMKADHAKDITSFTDHQDSVKNDQLRQYINEVLPKLKEHANMVVKTAQAKGISGGISMPSSGAGNDMPDMHNK